MNKGLKYFTEGIIAAFVLAPRVPVQSVKPVEIEDQRPIGNASKHWEFVGKRMTAGTKQIESDLKTLRPEFNSL